MHQSEGEKACASERLVQMDPWVRVGLPGGWVFRISVSVCLFVCVFVCLCVCLVGSLVGVPWGCPNVELSSNYEDQGALTCILSGAAAQNAKHSTKCIKS